MRDEGQGVMRWSEWIRHGGGPCPCPGFFGEAVDADGAVYAGVFGRLGDEKGPVPPDRPDVINCWDHCACFVAGRPGWRIVAYRFRRSSRVDELCELVERLEVCAS